MIQEIMERLKEMAAANLERIRSGEWWLNHVSDREFSALVPQANEDAVIAAMVESGEWWRLPEGFLWTPLLDTV